MNMFFIDFFIYIKFFFSLFALVNPIGLIPIFTTITRKKTIEERNRTNLIANISVSIILCVSLIFGKIILNTFGISINSFRIAGGILVIAIAFSMLNGKILKEKNKNSSKCNSENDDVSVIPLAMPLIAGPGAISSTIVWGSQHSSLQNLIICSVTILIFSFFCWALFKISPCIVRFLGKNSINIMTKIMGLLLFSIGVEFIIASIKSIFNV
ncbi:YchE family NAAT transporter [Buchnera aphidicola (Mindarus keteleerifoliae)]|uniref:YchE family NAAT transporter n=1 Tax=Buchnera aphidicola TaxID=9 RepID=UPI0031B67203